MKKINLFFTLFFFGFISTSAENVSFPAITIDLDCYTPTYNYTGGNDITITGAQYYYVIIKPLEEGNGNLDISNLQYTTGYGLYWIETVAAGELYYIYAYTAVINVAFSVDDKDITPGRYRDIKFKYHRSVFPNNYNSWLSLQTVTSDASVDDLTINGSYLVCYSPNKTYTIDGDPASSSFDWTKSSNLTQVGGSTSASYVVHAISTSVYDDAWVNVEVSKGACTWEIQKDLWVGKFQATAVTGTAAVCPDELYTYTAQVPGGHSSSYNYDWTYPGNWIWQAEMENWIRLKTAMYNPQYGTVRVRITNTCGTSGYSGMTVYPGYNCGGYYMAFPNPGSNYVDIDINPKMSTSMEDIYNNDISLSVYNKMGIVVLNSNVESLPYRIDTSGLPNGEYVVKIITRKKDGTEKDQRFESLKITVNH